MEVIKDKIFYFLSLDDSKIMTTKDERRVEKTYSLRRFVKMSALKIKSMLTASFMYPFLESNLFMRGLPASRCYLIIADY